MTMSQEVAIGGRWLGGAGITAVIGYLIATVAAGGRHPVWPYFLFAVLAMLGFGIYFTERRGGKTPDVPGRLSQQGRNIHIHGGVAGSTGPAVPPSSWEKAIPSSQSQRRGLFTHCQRCGYPFGAPIRQEFCNVRQACDRRLREPGYRVPKGRTQDLAIRNATIGKHPELGLHSVESPPAHMPMCVHTLIDDGGGVGCQLPVGHEGTHKSGDIEWPSGWNGLLYGRERQDWPSEARSLSD
jgi:hypothetical protein